MFFKIDLLTSVESTEQTPTKTYVKSRNDVVDLVFPSTSSITSTPKKKKKIPYK